ncbi:RNA polymerase sigma factor [Streptomyces sp. NPDC001070]
MTAHVRTRVRDGDPAAFAELFDAYARTVHNHAFRLTADRPVAGDVMAAAFTCPPRRALRPGRADPEGIMPRGTVAFTNTVLTRSVVDGLKQPPGAAG